MSARVELRVGVASALSVAVHLAILAYVSWYADTPDLGFEITLPAEVEFGLTEGATVQGGMTAAPTPATPPGGENAAAKSRGQGLDGGIADASVADASVDAGRRRRRRDAGTTDGGVGEGGRPVDALGVASAIVDAGVRDGAAQIAAAGGGPGEAGAGATGSDETRLPAGAQIALRIDMARIRRSPLAPDVRAFLAAIPDWQAVLGGSEIRPVDDLDRVLIASPNMQRSRMLLAGRYEGDVARVRDVVARMAKNRGVDAPWRDLGGENSGIQVAPWPNEDETERTIALVGPRHFTITRPEDLPRMLAVARARAERNAGEGRQAGEPDPPLGPDALVEMEEGEALSLEIEGARRFVRGRNASDVSGIPTRMHISVREMDPSNPRARVAVEARGWYETPQQASEARELWNQARESYARSPWVALAGMSAPLRSGTIEAEGNVIRFRTQLGPQQLRLVLAYLQGAMQQQARRERERTGGSLAPGGTREPHRTPVPDPR